MKKYLFLIGILFSIIFTGCGDGDDSSSGSNSSSFSGSSFKGIITSAVVEVYDFSNNTKGELISSGTVINSVLDLPDANYTEKVLLEIKKDDANTASYIDEDSGNSILFNDLVLKMIIDNFDETSDYITTPLTTIATELVLDGTISDIRTAYETVSKLFGLSFKNLNGIKPNIEGLISEQTDSTENEYALSLLSLVSLQNEIASQISSEFTIKDLIDLIKQDLEDGIFDGKHNNSDLTLNDGGSSLNIGDIPTKLSQAGSRSLSKKNPNLLNNMKGYFQRVVTASRTIEPPSIEIRGSENIKINEKSILSADGSKSPFGYTLTYSWSLKNSPENASVNFSSDTSSNTFITVDTEGNYTISLEISDGQNRVSEDYSFIADLDGDGLLRSKDLDRDGDGIFNTDDKFPDNPAEFLDTDDNNIGNYSQVDEDGDSVLDIDDKYPFDNTKSEITTFNESEFNGNLNDANVLTGTLPFKVSGVINGNGSDDDYFKFTSTAGTIISAKITKFFEEFNPIISMVDNNGNPISSILTIDDSNSTILTFRVPIDGTFALIVTDKSNQSNAQNTYTLTIFEDSDIDGVSNEFERAIGSNENSSDTDGDGIKDYYEINTTSFDIDSDGIPNWLDIDSDNDALKDSQENLTDYDNDGLLNPFDSDSDGNSVLDSIELGSNPDKPLDSDGDTFADYIDLDDDNDGILDINDNERIVSANIDATTFITIRGLISSQEITNFAQSKGSIKITGENFTSNAIVILVDSNGVYNLTPTKITDTEISVDIPDIQGVAQVRVYDNNKLTTSSNLTILNSFDPVIFDVSYPNSQSYALENDTVTINGINLSDITTVKINGISVNVTSSTNTSVTFIATNTLNSGRVIASTLNGESNDLSIFIGRQITGRVILPQGSSYNFSDLKIEFAGIESSINNDGTFTIIARNNDTSSITVFTPEDTNNNISIYLSALVLSDENSDINVDVSSTASSIMFSALNASSNVQNKTKEIFNIIKSNNDVFTNNLIQNLGSNPYYISEASTDYINALAESKTTIYNILKSNSLIRNVSINRSLLVNEIDDVSVWKDGDPINGKIRIDNDTMVFLDYMITNTSNGKTIKSYLNQYYGSSLIGPQDPSFFMYWASSSDYDVSFQNSKVTIISPKFRGMTASNFNTLPQYKLALRTVLSQGIFPIVNEAIGFNMSDGMTKVLLEKILIPAVNGGAIDHWASGEVGKGFEKFLGGLIQALATDGVKAILKEQMSLDAKAIANIATNVIGFAVPRKAVQLAGTAVDLGKTVIDFASIKDKMEFNVTFPINITDIYPTSIKNNGRNKTIVIESEGLEDYCSNFDTKIISYAPFIMRDICMSWHYPKVEVSSGSETLLLKLNRKWNNQYLFEIPSSFIDDANDEIFVKVKHVHNDKQYINELVDIEVDAPEVISIVNELEISNITPDTGSTGTTISISGAGFSTNISENKVYFTTSNGSTIANIIDASESELKVQVPLGTITGDVWVQVENEESNKLNFTVDTTQLSIRFGDNGSANDDTFALELNGKTIKSMTSPARNVYGSVELNSDQIYTVTLKGITAPDDVGTYYISFPNEIEVISGDSLSGSDLTAGVSKNWQIKLNTNKSLNRSINHSIIFKPTNQIIMQPEER